MAEIIISPEGVFPVQSRNISDTDVKDVRNELLRLPIGKLIELRSALIMEDLAFKSKVAAPRITIQPTNQELVDGEATFRVEFDEVPDVGVEVNWYVLYADESVKAFQLDATSIDTGSTYSEVEVEGFTGGERIYAVLRNFKGQARTVTVMAEEEDEG